MITLELVQKMWELITPPEKGEINFEARQVDAVNTPSGSPLLTIDIDHHRHLLIPIDHDCKVTIDKQSAGVHILVNQWGDEEKRRRFIDVVCIKSHLDSLFDIIVFEILKGLETTTEDPGKICRNILSRWRELLRPEPSGIPDKATIVGVIGELMLLRDLVKLDPSSVDIWTGPNKGRYDFSSNMVALEVKTTLQRSGLIVTIHGLSQLDPPPNGILYLSVFRLEETPRVGETISSLIRDITACGCEKVELLKKLVLLGIYPDLIDRCDDYRFSLSEQITYVADDSFPKISANSFKQDALPAQIVSLNYQLDLTSSPPSAMPREHVDDVYRRLVGRGGNQNA
jgi:hypothetical protein